VLGCYLSFHRICDHLAHLWNVCATTCKDNFVELEGFHFSVTNSLRAVKIFSHPPAHASLSTLPSFQEARDDTMYLGKNVGCKVLQERASKVNTKFTPFHKILQLYDGLGRFR
jgi:hypothetical protein